MPGSYTRETFFRPAEVSRADSRLPAPVYNALHLLLARSESDCVFVPLRAMQYQAVLTREEIIFVDSQGGYAQQDGIGGRLVRIAWQFPPAGARRSLTEPVPCEIVFYGVGLKEVQWRLMSEIRPAAERLLEQQRGPSPRLASVVPLKRES